MDFFEGNKDLFCENKGTVHIGAKKSDIAKIVLMAGDPYRAKKTADEQLTKVRLVSDIRGMLVFTGEYKGVKVTVMGHGMGIPSIGIYSYEIMKYYDADIVMRFGTCGALVKSINVGDILIASGACTDSNYAHQYKLNGTYSAIPDYELLENIVNETRKRSLPYRVGNVLSADAFYNVSRTTLNWSKLNVLGVEMEAFALYANAAYLGKRAIVVLTISDHLANPDAVMMTPNERQEKTQNMAKIALDAAINVTKR